MFCPTVQESIDATLKLLPRGRAWGGSEGPEPYHEAAFDAAAFDPAAFDTQDIKGSILYRFFGAVGTVRNYIEERICALRLEFWCQSVNETRDEWMFEYGLPDVCDPFPDLCTKVAALGGSRCEYFAAVMARAGWAIDCEDVLYNCKGTRAGRGLAGRAKAGSAPRSLCTLRVIIYLPESPAFTGRATRRPLAGRLRAGQRIMCPPDITPVICLLERIVPAHMTISYVTVS